MEGWLYKQDGSGVFVLKDYARGVSAGYQHDTASPKTPCGNDRRDYLLSAHHWAVSHHGQYKSGGYTSNRKEVGC